MASFSLILVVLSFLLTAAKSHRMHGSIADKGLPRAILPDTFSSFSTSSNGLVVMELVEDSCRVEFSSQVSQLEWENPIRGNLTYGRFVFFTKVVMRIAHNTSDIRVVKKIVANPLFGPIEFWSSETLMEARVSEIPFSTEKPCKVSSVENPGATLAQVSLSI